MPKPGDREAGYNLGLALNHVGRHAEGLKIIASGPGIVSLSLAPPAKSPARIAIPGGPHFIGAWTLHRPGVCDDLIAFFESRSSEHLSGRSAKGVDTTIKNSTDLTVQPADIADPAFAPVQAETLVVGFTSDWLFPPEQNRQIALALLRSGKRASYAELATDLGHDSFLLESEELYALVRGK